MDKIHLSEYKGGVIPLKKFAGLHRQQTLKIYCDVFEAVGGGANYIYGSAGQSLVLNKNSIRSTYSDVFKVLLTLY